jgi:glyoxylase-like metal-dependent hydrolase (beta-lactamase superfamily II)
MYFRQFLNDDTACASYLFGCKTAREFAVVDAHADLVDDYVAAAASQGSKIAAVLETHIQADHVSGLPQLVERTDATAYMPEGSGAEFAHHSLADGELVKLGNTVIEAIATPGHAPAHHSFLVTDHRRGDQPWFVLTGDSLLVGDVGRPDLHAPSADGLKELARTLYRSLHDRLLALPDHLLVYPAHYAGSVCGRGLSGHPTSSIGFERRHNEALAAGSEDAFVEAVLKDIPPAPEQQAEIVAANRSGEPSAAVA